MWTDYNSFETISHCVHCQCQETTAVHLPEQVRTWLGLCYKNSQAVMHVSKVLLSICCTHKLLTLIGILETWRQMVAHTYLQDYGKVRDWQSETTKDRPGNRQNKPWNLHTAFSEAFPRLVSYGQCLLKLTKQQGLATVTREAGAQHEWLSGFYYRSWKSWSAHSSQLPGSQQCVQRNTCYSFPQICFDPAISCHWGDTS